MSKQPKETKEAKTDLQETPSLITLTPSKVKPLEYANQSIIFPIIGEAILSDKGTVDVSPDQLEAFMEATKDSFGFYEHVAGDSKKPKSEVQKLTEEEVKLKADLDLLTFEELVELAKDSGIEAAELITMTDAKIKKTLLAKLIKQS